MNNTFKKDKLNNGCIVQTRDGQKRIYLENAKCFGSRKNMLIDLIDFCWTDIDSYSENLIHESNVDFDIVKICDYQYTGDNLSSYIRQESSGVFWTAVRQENQAEDLKEIMEEIRIKTEELNSIMARYEKVKDKEVE